MKELLEFVNKYATNIWLLFEIIAAITGLLLLKKYKKTVAKYFIFYLVYVVFFVIIGRYSYWVRKGPLEFLQGTLLEANYWWFTICWSIISTLFFSWYYLKILKNDKSKIVLKFSTIVFFIVSVTSVLLTLPDFFKGNINTIEILGAFIILECVFFYFMEVLQSDKILKFYKSLTFYISCAILLLKLIQTPLIFFQPYFRTADMDYVNLRNLINVLVISFMYITYTIGLIVSNPDYD